MYVSIRTFINLLYWVDDSKWKKTLTINICVLHKCEIRVIIVELQLLLTIINHLPGIV